MCVHFDCSFFAVFSIVSTPGSSFTYSYIDTYKYIYIPKKASNTLTACPGKEDQPTNVDRCAQQFPRANDHHRLYQQQQQQQRARSTEDGDRHGRNGDCDRDADAALVPGDGVGVPSGIGEEATAR